MQDNYRAAAIPGFSPGYRNANSGALNAVGNYGYSLSSSVSGTNGMWLEFRPTLVDPGFTNNRANGLQVRCLQAFIGILFIMTYGNGAFSEVVSFSQTLQTLTRDPKGSPEPGCNLPHWGAGDCRFAHKAYTSLCQAAPSACYTGYCLGWLQPTEDAGASLQAFITTLRSPFID